MIYAAPMDIISSPIPIMVLMKTSSAHFNVVQDQKLISVRWIYGLMNHIQSLTGGKTLTKALSSWLPKSVTLEKTLGATLVLVGGNPMDLEQILISKYTLMGNWG